jgi:LmbE family N-acetylglucosaminyl deacetylase
VAEDVAASTDPVLAVFAHPDDAEISAGATMAKWVSVGREVHLLILTNGDRGSSDPEVNRSELARTRAAETEAAARVLGLASARVLGTHDGELENIPGVRADVVRAIRELRPGTVLTCDPTAWIFENRYYNHHDHRTAGEIALDAVFPAAGNPHFFADQLTDDLRPHDVTDVWLGWSNEPTHHEDVTGFLATKLAALAEHASQVSGDGIRFFEEWLPREAEEAGAKIGATHAESFRVLALE